jgi:hypothetical protein
VTMKREISASNDKNTLEMDCIWLDKFFCDMELSLELEQAVCDGYVPNRVKEGAYFFQSHVLEQEAIARVLADELSFDIVLKREMYFVLFALKNIEFSALPVLPLEIVLICCNDLYASFLACSRYYRTLYALLRLDHISLYEEIQHDEQNKNHRSKKTSQHFKKIDILTALQLYLFCEKDLRQMTDFTNAMAGFKSGCTWTGTRLLYDQLRQQTFYSKFRLLDLLMYLIESLPAFKLLTQYDCLFFPMQRITTNIRTTQHDKTKKLCYVAFNEREILLFDAELNNTHTALFQHLVRWSCDDSKGRVYLDLGDYGGPPYLALEDKNIAKVKRMGEAIEYLIAYLLSIRVYAEEGEADLGDPFAWQ